MEMEVVIPIHHNMDFDFNSARSSPRRHIVTAPSTPKRFGEEYYFSAPASPSRISPLFYRDFEEFYSMINDVDEVNGYDGGSGATVPFDWEEKPGKPKIKSPIVAGDSNDNNGGGGGGGDDYDFAFEVSEDFETASVSAEDLFDGGVIKPLKPPPPRLQLPDAVKAKTAPAISPRHREKEAESDFCGTGTGGTTSSAAQRSTSGRTTSDRQRGRERAPAGGMSSSSRRATRSLSPLRVSDEFPLWEDEDQQQTNKEQTQKPSPTSNFPCNSSALSKNLKKWSFKDFFLFRSASEGRASDKDPFRKYTVFRRYEEARMSIGGSNSRTIEGPVGGSSGGSISRRRGPPVSAHELHYTINRAVSEDMKKKTFLPYKQGILGRLAFNPTVHALANGFGFSRN